MDAAVYHLYDHDRIFRTVSSQCETWVRTDFHKTFMLVRINFRKRGRRESIFCLAGDTAKQKGFRPFNASLIIGAIAIKRLRSSSRRDGVFDPIAVSRLDQKKIPLSDLCGSAVSLILKGAHANQKSQ
jgi:hypothetical protein